MRTVLRDNFLLQKLNKSSRLGPSKSITRTLYSPSTPDHFAFGIPASKLKIANQKHLTQVNNSNKMIQSSKIHKFIKMRAYFLLAVIYTASIHTTIEGAWFSHFPESNNTINCFNSISLIQSKLLRISQSRKIKTKLTFFFFILSSKLGFVSTHKFNRNLFIRLNIGSCIKKQQIQQT